MLLPSGRLRAVAVAWGAFLGLLFALAPAPVWAQPAAVETLIQEGVELRRKGSDHLALPKFQKAYDIERSPRTAAQLGLAEASLGYWLAAEQHLTEALQSTRNPWLAKHEPTLRKTLKEVQASIGEVEIIGTPAGATVTVNGQQAGQMPLTRPVRVPEGAVQVSLRADGHREASKSISVQGGKRALVSFSLELLPSPVMVATPTPAPPVASVQDGVADQTPARRSLREASWVRPTSWFLGAASVAALGVGGYGLLNQRKRGKEFDDYKPPGSSMAPCGEDLPGRGGEQCKVIYGRMRSAQNLMIGGLVAGGVLAAAAVTGFVLSTPSDGPAPGGRETALSLGLGDGRSTPVSLAWGRRF